MTINRNAWKDMTLGQLLEGISSASGGYAREANEKLPRKEGNPFKRLDQLPEAMLYRARVIEQFVDEIKARAWDLQQEDYDSKSSADKVLFHENEIRSIKGVIDDEDELDFYLMDEIGEHQVCIVRLSYPPQESTYKFGDK